MPAIRRSLEVAGLILAGAGFAACARVASDRGVASMQFLGAAAEPSRSSKPAPIVSPNDEPGPIEARVAAEPIEPLAKPVYPVRALAAHVGRIWLDRRIEIDAQGRVVKTEPSFLALPEAVPYAAEFEAAIEAAVAQWRFVPAQVQVLQPWRRGDQPPVWRVRRSEATEDAVEVVFTFDSSGTVTSAWRKR